MSHPDLSFVSRRIGIEGLPQTKRNEGIAEALARFLSQFEWTHFVTLTTRFKQAENRVLRVFHQRFVRPLARIAQCRIPHFLVVEATPANGVPHIHALLGGTASLTTQRIESVWPEGFCDIKKYDPAKGAAYYVTKSLESNPDSWDLSRHRPAVRPVDVESVVRPQVLVVQDVGD